MDFSIDQVEVTYDAASIDPVEVYDYLKTSYWASDRTLEQVKQSLGNTLVVLGLKFDGKLVGFGRIITDGLKFGYLCDVFVLEPYRGYGLGKLLVKKIMEHPMSRDLKRISLHTKDAHKLYEKFGFMYDEKKIFPNGNVTYAMTYNKVNDDFYVKYFTKDDMDEAIELVKTHWDPQFVRLVHPMYYRDFYKTCFSARACDGELIGFALGYLSQDNPGEGYIHTILVHPEWRGKGVAQTLYKQVFQAFINRGVNSVRLITSTQNKLSQEFHKRMGFDYAKECNITIDGIPVVENYAGKGLHRVVMERKIGV